jgi:hypothetical protein
MALKTYPRVHNMDGYFELSAESSTKKSTILPILFHDQGLTAPEDFIANPYNENFSSTTERMACYGGSKVERINLDLKISIPFAAKSEIDALMFRTMPIAVSFDDIEKATPSGGTIGSILRLQREDTNEDTVHPIFGGTPYDLTADDLPSDVMGLTTDQNHEGISFDIPTFEKYMKYSTQKGLLKSLTQGGLRTHTLYSDRPYRENRWFDNPSKTKRMNNGTFLGLLFAVDQVDAGGQFWTSGETTAISHLRVGWSLSYNEYNDAFNQQP